MTPHQLRNGRALCPRCDHSLFLTARNGDAVACSSCGFVCTEQQAVLAWEAAQGKSINSDSASRTQSR